MIISINNHLIEQTEHPERYAMGCANLNIVDSQIAVCYVLYLLKGLVSASNFNGDGVINKVIARAGKGQGQPRIHKKSSFSLQIFG